MALITDWVTATGAGTYTVPAGIYRLKKVEGVAGGAGGGDWGLGAGGGGAAYSAEVEIAVTPGQVIPLNIGTGGAGTATAPPGAGADTWFGASSYGAAIVGAKGGSPPNGAGTGGLGGLASGGIGSIRFSGGKGGDFGGTNGGGGGGGAAGPNGDGGDGGPSCNYDQAFNTCGAGGGGNGGGADGARAGGSHDANDGGRGAGGNNFAGVGGGVPGSHPAAAFDGGGGSGGQLDGFAQPGEAGSDGIDLGDLTKGGGGGGGGGNVGNVFHQGGAGGHGGLYGGGGGSSGGYATIGVGGDGAPGVIAVTYEDPQAAYLPGAGALTFTGLAPVLAIATYQPGTGSLIITPRPPSFSVGSLTLNPGAGRLIITGQTPSLEITGGLDWRQTVISQYQNSPTLLQLIENLNEDIAPGVNLNAFYDLVWNINTAQGYGLDVWGRIVGIGRVLHIAGSITWFGFEEAGDAEGFNVAPFYSGTPTTDNFSLSDSAYRQLILAKALSNICDGSIPAINQILLSLFPGRGNAYVTDGEDMSMTYTFEFALTPVELAIVSNSGVLPKPAGVSLTVVTP